MVRDHKTALQVSGLELLDLFRRLRSPSPGGSERKRVAVASQAGISRGYLSDILNGNATPGPDIAERVARALGGNDADAVSARMYAERAQGETRGGDESTVVGGAIGFERWPPAATPVQVLRSLSGPISSLLAAEQQVVDFLGRQKELKALAAWRDADGGPAVMLIHGSGGEGKTRLAMRFAERSARWRTVRAVRRDEITGGRPASPRPTGRTKGVLVVVDYAERWRLQEFLERALDAELRGTAPVRLLLIARIAGSWWDVLSTRLHRLGVATSDLPLGAVDHGIDREAVFRAACTAFGSVLSPVDTGRIDLPPSIGDEPFGHVLTLHMAALAAVDAAARRERPPEDPGALTAYLLRRERDHWQHMSERDAQATTAQTMAKVVYVATLAGPLSHSDASTTLGRVGVASVDRAGQVLHDHAVCYPPAVPGAVLQPLYPDRLGEDYLALCTPAGPEGGPVDDEVRAWASTAPDLLYSSTPAGSRHGRSRGMMTLLEAACRWPHVASGVLAPLLLRNPSLVVAAGGAALARLTDVPDLDLAVLAAVHAAVPVRRHVDLDAGIATLTQCLTKLLLARTPDPGTRAGLLRNLGARLHDAGWYDEAVKPLREAVQALEGIRSDDTEYQMQVAITLTSLSRTLTALGKHAEASADDRRALKILRRLSAVRYEDYAGLLAMTLVNSSIDYWNDGEHEVALETAREGVEMWRALCDGTSVETEAHLAAGLNNLGYLLDCADRPDAALDAVTEAVAIRRRLALADAPTFEPDLANSLLSLGACLSRLGRTAEALPATAECAAIRRRHAAVNPTAFEPTLAMALDNLATPLDALGRTGDARTALEEALVLWRRHAAANPEAHRHHLAGSLHNLSAYLLRTGDVDGALAATRESVTLYQLDAATNPEKYEAALARALEQLAYHLAAAERPASEVAEAALESVARLWHFAAQAPAMHQVRLAKAATRMRDLMYAVGATDAGSAMADAAVQVCRDLTAADPDTGSPLLLAALKSHARRGPVDAGPPDQQLAVSTELVNLCRELARTDPGRYEVELAQALYMHATSLDKAGLADDAVSAGEESVHRYRSMHAASGTTDEEGLATALRAHAVLLFGLGRLDEAVTAFRQESDILRRIVDSEPLTGERTLEHEYVSGLNIATSLLATLGRTEEALAANAESVLVQRALIEVRPEHFHTVLALTLDNRALLLARANDAANALDASREAVALIQARRWPDGMTALFAEALSTYANLTLETGTDLRAGLAAVDEALARLAAAGGGRPGSTGPDPTDLQALRGDLRRRLAVREESPP